MRSKSSRIEQSRLRKDFMFTRVVALFAWLVLATFAILLIHISYNALPLFFTPKVEPIGGLTQGNSSSSRTPFLGLYQLQGEWFYFSSDACSLQMQHIDIKNSLQQEKSQQEKSLNAKPVNVFSIDCDAVFLAIIEDNGLYFVSLGQNDVVEIYQIKHKENIQLFASFVLPKEFSKSNIDNWELNLRNQQVSIVQYDSKQEHVVSMRYTLGSLDEPTINVFKGQGQLFNQVINNQFIFVQNNKASIFDEQAELLQEIELQAQIVSADVSPHLLDLVMITAAEQSDTNKNEALSGRAFVLHKFTFYNQNGDFYLNRVYQTDVKRAKQTMQALDDQKFFIAFDLGNDGLFVLSQNGLGLLYNLLTGELHTEFSLNLGLQDLSYEQSQLALFYKDSSQIYQLSDLQGLISIKTLLAKNHYSSYQYPEYIWQTSVSNAEQTPKYSVVPLIMGSLKASILAIIVAFPLALGAAIYTAYFASSKIRNAVKPSIEMLEAVPSVIIGFIAAIWLAPFAEQHLISIFLLLVLLPFLVVLIAAVQAVLVNQLGDILANKARLYINLGLMFSGTILVILLSVFIANWSSAYSDNFLVYFFSNLTLSKTAIVVSLALGFAVAPTIYTLIDDALYEVPEGVKQASFALGATEIQTLVRVVLVVAFPSIVAAFMLGFGRAFGETMIVLMVTGNTPIANWDLLDGLRTLTSNLAIELQEASVGSPLYRVLFLSAAILFLFTFIVNTLAAVIRRNIHKAGS